MYIPRLWIGMLVVIILLGIQWLLFNMFNLTANQQLAFILIEIVLTIPIMSWLTRPAERSPTPSQRVENVLRQLKDDDLDLLRHRLMQDEREEEYGSMAELMQSSKRKNEMR